MVCSQTCAVDAGSRKSLQLSQHSQQKCSWACTHPDGVVCRSAIERAAVGRHGQRPHPAAVPLQHAQAVPVGSAPHPYRLIIGAAEQQAAVEAQRQRQHRG